MCVWGGGGEGEIQHSPMAVNAYTAKFLSPNMAIVALCAMSVSLLQSHREQGD